MINFFFIFIIVKDKMNNNCIFAKPFKPMVYKPEVEKKEDDFEFLAKYEEITPAPINDPSGFEEIKTVTPEQISSSSPNLSTKFKKRASNKK